MGQFKHGRLSDSRFGEHGGRSGLNKGQTFIGFGDLLSDGLVDLVLQVFSRDAHGAGNGSLARGGMRLHNGAVEPKQWRAPIHFRVHPAADRMKCALGQQCPELALGVGGQLALEHGKKSQRQALGGFQHDVANESVTNNNVNAVSEQVVSLNVANEVQVQMLAQFESLQCQLVAFAFFSPDAQNADPRSGRAEQRTGVNATHDGVMRQMDRFAFDIRA